MAKRASFSVTTSRSITNPQCRPWGLQPKPLWRPPPGELPRPDGGISNAIVTPAKGSNHFVGHAIDMNLQLDSGEFFNSSKLRKLADQPKEVRDFIQKVQDDPELRWGGDFRTPDIVHIDDGLNLRQPDVWKTKFESRG